MPNNTLQGARSNTGIAQQPSNTTTSGGPPAVTPNASSLSIGLDINSVPSTVGTLMMGDFAEPESANPLPAFNGPVVTIDASLNNYVGIDSKGLNEQRPELISVFDFNPAYETIADNSSLIETPVLELLNIQLSSRQLRAENILRLINELRANASTKQQIQVLENKLIADNQSIEQEIRFLQEIHQALAQGRLALSVRKNMDAIKSDMASRSSKSLSADPIKDIIVDTLGFSEQGYNNFTNTKILLQLIDDLRNTLVSYSPLLVEQKDERRINDIDPYRLQRVADVQQSLAVDVSAFRSTSSDDVKRVLSRDGLETFTNSLNGLIDADDRMKVLIALISKELRVSAGLGIPVVRSAIKNAFNVQDAQIDDNIFNDLLGVPGQTIFDESEGIQNSIARLMRIQSGGDVVLPFESVFINRANSDTTIPGHKFYIDSIVKGEQKLNTAPFKNFGTVLGSTLTSLGTIIEGTFDVNVVNDEDIGLSSSDVLDKFLKINKAAIDELSTQPVTARDSFLLALFNAAADDITLKHMLVLYIMQAGVASAYQPGSRSKFFRAMIEAADFNAGTSISREDDPTAGILRAISQIRASQPREVSNVPGVRSPEDDRLSLLVSGRSIRPGTAGSLSDNGLDVITSTILDRVGALLASRGVPTVTRFDIVDDRQVFDRMSSLGGDDSSYILRSIIEFIDTLDLLARNAMQGRQSGDYFSDAKPGLTRFNNFGAHTLVWMVVELFVTFFKTYAVTTFSSVEPYIVANASRKFTITRDEDLIDTLSDALDDAISTQGFGLARLRNPEYIIDENRRRLAQITASIAERFSTMRAKFNEEDAIIRDITNALIAIGNAVKSSTEKIVRFFDIRGPNAQLLQQILDSIDANEKLAVMDDAQLALSRNALMEYTRNKASNITVSTNDATRDSVTSPFADDTTYPLSVRSALMSFLKSSALLKADFNNVRLLSVGLPAGFMQSLNANRDILSQGQSIANVTKLSNLQRDVFKVNVYMRDLLFEDVVFKPKSFIFEGDRFVGSIDFEGVRDDDERSFETLINEAITTRVINSRGEFVTENFAATANDVSYDGVLTQQQKNDMVRNHVTSYMLRVYIKLLTGVDLAEDAYYVNDKVNDMRVDDATRQIFQDLITKRLSSFARRPITLTELRAVNAQVDVLLSRIDDDIIGQQVISTIGQVLDDANKAANVEISEELVTFMKTFTPSSILFGSGARRLRISSPKLFERILNIAIDPDDFEIDMQRTTSTQSGQAFIGSSIASSLLEQLNPIQLFNAPIELNDATRYRFLASARRALGNLSLQEFFVSIESMPENVTSVVPLIPAVQRVPSPPAQQSIRNAALVDPTSQLASSSPVKGGSLVGRSVPQAGSQGSSSNSSPAVDWTSII